MKVGIHYGRFSHPGGPTQIASELRATAQAAEQGGVARFTLMDHYLQLPQTGRPDEPMLEGYATLGWIAGQTSSIELGLLVTGVTYRHPALLAKIIATLDTLAPGRIFLGLGAAWYEQEHTALGIPFPPLGERLARVEETARLCRQMWSADDGAFNGKYYALENSICSPAPSRRVPILIGGAGEKVTLRIVAAQADGCNFMASSPDEARHKLSVLERHCDEIGRDHHTIEKTLLSYDRLDDPGAFVDSMQEYAALGFDLVELRPDWDDPAAFVERVATSVIPELDPITARS